MIVIPWRKFFLAGALGLFVVTLHAAGGASATVEKAVTEILVILKDPTLKRQQRWDRIAPVIDANFDFHTMSQSVLATHWKSATPEEKRQFVEFFSQYLENTYRTKIEAYTNQTVEFRGEKVRGGRATVDTLVKTDGTEIPIIYKMREDTSGKWLAYDVVIEGISLVANYRDTYNAIAKSSGVQGILADLQSRLKKYEHSGNAQRSQSTTTQ